MIAVRELIRRPGRFLAAGGALTMLVLLLTVLGGFLDGLVLGATGALRAQDAQLVTFSDTARQSLLRSTLDEDAVRAAAVVPGVAAASGLGISPMSAQLGDQRVDIAVVGYGRGTERLPAPPDPGEALADRRLGELTGLELGDTLALGAGELPLRIVGWVSDTTFQLQPTVWTDLATWREATAQARPGALAAPMQALLVELESAADPAAVAGALDRTVGGTETVTMSQAIDALPGVREQRGVFTGIIGVTFAVAGLVVALFFALLTLERVQLYAVLKAVGARTSDIMRGLAAQAILIALGALAAGALAALALAVLAPADLPLQLTPARLAQVAGGVVITALLGSLVTVRRILRIQPAQAIG